MSCHPLKCMIAGCSNSSLDTRKSNERISFHRFPRDPRLKAIWTKNCGFGTNYNLGRGSVCSRHFSPSAFLHYQKGLKSNHGGMVKLVRGAVPTLNLPVGKESDENEAMGSDIDIEDTRSICGSDGYGEREDDIIILEITSIAGKHQSTKVIEPSTKRQKTCPPFQSTCDSDENSSNDELDIRDCVSTSFYPCVTDKDEPNPSDPDEGTEVDGSRRKLMIQNGSSSPASDNVECYHDKETNVSKKPPFTDSPIMLPTNPLPVLVKQGNAKRMMLLRSSPVPQQTAVKPILVNQGNNSQLMYLQDIPPKPKSQSEYVHSCSSRVTSSAKKVLQQGESSSVMGSDDEVDSCDDSLQLHEESSSNVAFTSLPSSMNHKYDTTQVKTSHSGTSPATDSPDKALIDRLHKSMIQQMEDKMKLQAELYKKRLHAADLRHRLKVIQLNERIQSLQCQLQDVPEIVRKGTHLGRDSKTVQNDRTQKAISLEVWQLLNKTFTDNEIKVICDGKRHIRWKDSELLKAYTLRCLSYGAYVFVRDKLKYPLPSTKYLTRWLTSIKKKRELNKNARGAQEDVIDEEDLEGFDDEIYIETVDTIGEALNSDGH